MNGLSAQRIWEESAVSGHSKIALWKRLQSLQAEKQKAVENKDNTAFAICRMAEGTIREKLGLEHPEQPTFNELVED